MDNCFSLNPTYVFKIDNSVQQENLKPSVFAMLRDWQKKDKNILVSIEKEKQKLTLIVIF